MIREGQSNLIDEILFSAAKKEDKKPEVEKEKALNVMKRFKDPKHKLHVKKHIDRIEKGHAPKKVLQDFFKDLKKNSSVNEIDKIAGFSDTIVNGEKQLEKLFQDIEKVQQLVLDAKKELKELNTHRNLENL